MPDPGSSLYLIVTAVVVFAAATLGSAFGTYLFISRKPPSGLLNDEALKELCRLLNEVATDEADFYKRLCKIPIPDLKACCNWKTGFDRSNCDWNRCNS